MYVPDAKSKKKEEQLSDSSAPIWCVATSSGDAPPA